MIPNNPGAALRILHAPRNVAHQASDVAAALRRMGHHVEVWVDQTHAFAFPADRVLDYAGRDPRVVWDTICEAIERFDILHFHYGRTLVPGAWGGLPPFWDLPLYRALGKRVFFTFHGTDVRIGRIYEQVNPWAGLRVGLTPPDDDRTEKALQLIRTYADHMFVTSANNRIYLPQAEYLPRTIDLSAWPELAPAQRERPVILHAPSRRATKGTDLVLAALDDLAADGVEFELRLLEGVTHEMVRTELAAADILVDNVIAGAYGIVSLEAMASSRVAIANLSDEVRQAHPDAPVVHVDPPTLRDTMRALIADADGRRRLAALGRPFVERVHSTDRVAERLVEAYTAPAGPVRAQPMPDWVSHSGQRQVEKLERRLGDAEMDLARSRHKEAILRARLGLPADADIEAGAWLRSIGRLVIPPAVRPRLRAIGRRVVPARVRARLRRRR